MPSVNSEERDQRSDGPQTKDYGSHRSVSKYRESDQMGKVKREKKWYRFNGFNF